MGIVQPSPRAAHDMIGAVTVLLAVLLAGDADAQASASQRKTMEFGVVPSDPRQVPQRPEAVQAPTAPQAAPQETSPQAPGAAASQAAPQAAAAAPTMTMPSVQAGLLECRGAFATGYGFGSSRKVTCEFRPSAGMVQYYVGTLDRVGLDIGVSDQGSMLWGVLGTSRDLQPGALAGRYVGVTSGFALGPGFSANMLASEDATRQITLQPVSVSADSGLSLSIAGATLTLESSATRPR